MGNMGIDFRMLFGSLIEGGFERGSQVDSGNIEMGI